ncbi:MAG: DUF928 domain-containing protein [Oscillatoria sp. PMC 1051.18]|nr:DUF928 domain-containing protein [Oscillatoria sp. PMC 1050.18]MEC5028839.1 DUF928 domain-containing protein [Oscillatoria sp. PMC 1051.18]
MPQIFTKKLAIALGLASILIITPSSFSEQVLAQRSNNPRQGLPGRRVGGGTRGGCNFGARSLTALIPENNLSLTVAENPSLFFYLPEYAEGKTIEFVLRDEQDRLVYETTFTPTLSAGIVSYPLSNPQDSVPLKVGEKYRWYFSVICNPENRANDVSVDGWIERIEPNQTLASQLQQATLDEQVELYREAGLWNDALTILAQLRYSRPNDVSLAAQWAQLLELVELVEVAEKPLLESTSESKPLISER